MSQQSGNIVVVGPGTSAPGEPGFETGSGDGPSLTPGPGPGAQMSLAGAVGSVAGSCPSLTLQFGPITVTTGASTTFAGVACGSIKRNDRLGVVGTTQAGGAVAASCITGL